MNNNKQSSVEWLDRWFRDNPEATHEEGNRALEQAKAMHQQEVIDAFGVGCQVEASRLIGYHKMAEQYYEQKYGKGNIDNTAV